MKKIIYLYTLLFIGVLCSCNENDGAHFPEPTAFSVTPTTHTLSSAGGDVEIKINGGNLGWSITSNNPWVKISKSFGSGDATVKLTVSANTTGAKRESSIVVKPTFNLDPVIISIIQN